MRSWNLSTSHPLGGLRPVKKTVMTSGGEDVEKLEPLCTVGANVK